MAVNKVIYDGDILMDLTGDTVTADSLLKGYTAHDATGAKLTGGAVIPTKLSELENDSGFAKRQSYTANLSATGWSGSSAPYTQSVSISGILATDMPHIVPSYSTTNATAILEKAAWNCVSKAVTADRTITFTCFEEKPGVGLSLQIEVVR